MFRNTLIIFILSLGFVSAVTVNDTILVYANHCETAGVDFEEGDDCGHIFTDVNGNPTTLPSVSGEASTGGQNPTTGGQNPATGGQNPGKCADGKLCNPLTSQTITELILKIFDVIIIFLLPIIILYIMYAGFLFVTAAGNSEQIKTARSALTWSVIGGVIVLGAQVIVTIIEGTITGFL